MTLLSEAIVPGNRAFTHALSRAAPEGAVPLDAFRTGMRALAGAVSVLTTIHEGTRWGLTATAVCSLSAEPPRLIVCVNQRGASYAAMQASRLIGINVLSHDQFAVGERFAGLDRTSGDRFEEGHWRAGRVGDIPVLDEAICVFECRVSEIIDAVSHGLMICDIFHVATNPGKLPLLYCDGRFTTLANKLLDSRHAHAS